MNSALNPIVDGAIQCWGCPVFDRLFAVISYAAAAVYDKFALFCIILFCILFAFYVLSAVWKNLNGDADPFYEKSIKSVFINSAFVLALLGMGVMVPRFVTTITFEPVAEITATYAQSVLRIDEKFVNENVSYTPAPMKDDGFFRPQLRDKVIMIMKTTITQFQAYIKLGLAVIDKAFSWDAILGIGALIRHAIMLFVGIYLVYGFFKLFVKFCFYFVDLIIAMTFFAFFFPLSLTLFVFRNADGAPKWMSALGEGIGTKQLKDVISAIVGLAAAVVTYSVIMMIIANFFAADGESGAQLMTQITNQSVFQADLDEDNIAMITLTGAIVLVYVLNFIYSQIPNVTKMILDVFNVSTDTSRGEELANNMIGVVSGIGKDIAKRAKIVITGGGASTKPAAGGAGTGGAGGGGKPKPGGATP